MDRLLDLLDHSLVPLLYIVGLVAAAWLAWMRHNLATWKWAQIFARASLPARRQLETINVAFVLRRMTFGFCDAAADAAGAAAAASQTNANGYDKSPPTLLPPPPIPPAATYSITLPNSSLRVFMIYLLRLQSSSAAAAASSATTTTTARCQYWPCKYGNSARAQCGPIPSQRERGRALSGVSACPLESRHFRRLQLENRLWSALRTPVPLPLPDSLPTALPRLHLLWLQSAVTPIVCGRFL